MTVRMLIVDHSVIRSISHNRLNDTILIVWHFRTFNDGLRLDILMRDPLEQVGFFS